MITHRVKVRPYDRRLPEYWAEAPVCQPVEDVVRDIADGQYERAIEVEAYDERLKRGIDVSPLIAGLVGFRLTAHRLPVPRSAREFMERHLGPQMTAAIERDAA